MNNIAIKVSKYQIYIISYYFFFIGYVINANIFKQELFLVFLFVFSIIELKNLYDKPKYIIIMWGLSIFSLISFAYRGVYINASLPVYFSMLAVLVYSYNEKRIGYKINFLILMIFSVYVSLNILIGIDPNDILDNRSRNMVSFYTLMFAIYYYIQKYRYTQKIELWPALIALSIAIITIGRSGIVSAILLLLLIIYFKYSQSSRLKQVLYIIISFFLCILGLKILDSSFDSIISSNFTRFQERGLDSDERSAIITQYLGSISQDVNQLLFGSTLDHYIFSVFKYNLHNSFLSLHYFAGIFSIVVIIFIFKALFFVKGKLFFKGLLLILLIRGITDQIFFFNFNDVIIFYLLFFINSKNNYEIHEYNPNEKIITN